MQHKNVVNQKRCNKPINRAEIVNRLLSAPIGYERRKMVADIARQEGRTISTVYGWVNKSGNRLLTKSGKPRNRRVDAGPTRPAESKAILDYRKKNPFAKGAEIKVALGSSYSVASINYLLRNAGLTRQIERKFVSKEHRIKICPKCGLTTGEENCRLDYFGKFDGIKRCAQCGEPLVLKTIHFDDVET